MARALAAKMELPYHELAAGYWHENWQPAPADVFREWVTGLAADDRWVIDGLYLKAITWSRADTLIWLDYPLTVVLARLVRRTLQRIQTGEQAWGTTNRETWRRSFFSRDALIGSVIRTHHARRRSYLRKLGKSQYAHLSVHRLRTPQAADHWLDAVPNHAQHNS